MTEKHDFGQEPSPGVDEPNQPAVSPISERTPCEARRRALQPQERPLQCVRANPGRRLLAFASWCTGAASQARGVWNYLRGVTPRPKAGRVWDLERSRLFGLRSRRAFRALA